jgi:hypothetical protein
MASKKVLVEAFYDQISNLVKEMSEMYPEDADFSFYLTGIQLMKTANPSMMIKYVVENVSPFENMIIEKNDKFFLDYGFEEYEGHVNSNIFVKLKQYISTMSESSKECVWKYIHNIMRLSKACS